ncbi:MAG: hypothetical protein KF696_10010 [Planctomycetes bacterium]|nr:hypothetical protein [Planctomycetota bacterium]MCW8136191.1 hypothetical protein [Planctomycetota bacterium]
MTTFQYFAGLAFTGVMALTGGFAANLVMQPATPVSAQEAPGIVRGSEFRLVGKNGKEVGLLDIDSDGGGRISLLDGNGKVRVQVAAGGKKAFVTLLDDAGTIRYLVGQDNQGEVMQAFADKKGSNRNITSVKSSGETLFALLGPKGENSATLLGDPAGASTLMLTSPDGKNKLVTYARNDQTAIQLNAGDGELLNAVLGDGRPVAALTKAEKLRLRSMLGADGTPELIFLNDKREATWRGGK